MVGQRKRWGLTAILVAVLSIFVAAGQSTPARAISPIHITGTVTNQSGSGVANAAVTATDPGGSTVAFGPSNTATDGSYQLDVEAGTYDFHFTPAAGSGLNPVVQSSVTVFSDQTISVQLSPAPPPPPVKHVFSGAVHTSIGQLLSNLRITLGDASGITSLNPGHFSLSVTPGVYSDLVGDTGQFNLAFPNPPYPNYPYAVHISAGSGAPSFDLTNGDVTQDLQMPATTTLDVVVHDANGNPVPAGKPVNADGVGSAGATFPFVVSGPSVFKIDTTSTQANTDANGVAHLVVFGNATFDAGKVCVRAVEGFTSSFCNMAAVNSDNGNATVTLTQPAPPTHVFSGTLRDTAGTPVPGVTVSLGNFATRTTAGGQFSLTVSPAAYLLSLSAGGANGPIHVPGVPGFFSIGTTSGNEINLTNADVTTDLTLPPVATLTLLTKTATGDPAPNRPYTYNGDLLNFALLPAGNPVYKASVSDSFSQTDGNGSATFTVFANTSFAANSICANFSNPVAHVCNTAAVNAGTGGQTVTLTAPVPNPTFTFSGTLRDASGNPVPTVNLNLGTNGFGRTDASGNFTMTASPGTYPFALSAGGANGPIHVPGVPGFFSFNGQNVNLTGNITQDLQLPQTATVTATVKDLNGSGLANANIDLDGQLSNVPLFVGSSLGFSGGVSSQGSKTDNTGSLTMIVFRNATFAPGSICATLGAFHQCNTATLNTTGGNINLIFQQQPPLPGVPSNLAAASPTQQPVLNWIGANGAAHYDVYRDGNVIGSPTTTTFTDTTAIDGAHSYFVKAVNDAGASGPSNTVNVLVDTTAPAISYSLSPTANAAGWNNADATVTFICEDTGSGLASCPAPATVTAEGSQTVSGTATDNAGNSRTVTAALKLDKTAPVITATATPLPNAAGWNSADITINFTCSDALSGIASCPAPQVVSTEGSQTIAGTATDIAGNTATASVAVKIDKTNPTIIASATPAANAAGWRNTDITVSFTCGDNLSGLASCPAPLTVSADTASQVVGGTATDVAGNSASASLIVKLDKTAPNVGNFTLPSKTVTQTKIFTAPASDNLSGVASGEWFIGSDPGQGNGTPMTFNSGNLSGTLGTNLPVGSYPLYVRSLDAAGNWSSLKSARLVVTQTGTSTVTASGTYMPSSGNGDQLPGLTSNFGLAQYNLSTGFTASGINPSSTASLTYSYGTSGLCLVFPTSTGCHRLSFTATTFSALIFSGTNNGQATITGTATVTLDGITTTNNFSIALTDSARAGGADHFQLTIYAPANPATVLYAATNAGTVHIM